MRFLTSLLFAALISFAAPAQSISDLLKGIGGSKNDTTATSSGTKGAIGAIIGAVTGALSSNDITGTWTYSGPAVTFKSDNLLMKVGGAAGSAAIESKLKPYYKKAGLDNMVLTVNADSTFTLKTKLTTLKGTIEYGKDNITMDFKVLGKVKIGKMDAAVSGLTSKTLKLTFDVSKLTKLLSAVSSVAGGQIGSITKLLEQYDGIQAGFALTRAPESTAKK
ncbi:MAG: DUF4923 family protein [Muribaculum sp.]|nr:DUF4923 family protein [Muribaculum sp.]